MWNARATLPRRCAGATSATGLRTLFADVLLPRLDPDDVAFLTAVAPLEQLEPHLCAAVTGRRDCRELLKRLRNDTPMLHAAEGASGCGCTPHVATCCCAGSMSFPKASARHCIGEQQSGCTQLECTSARRTALAAGRHETAYAWIAQALFGLVASGRVVAARDWLERLPESTVLGNDRLRLVAAWLRALSNDLAKLFR